MSQRGKKKRARALRARRILLMHVCIYYILDFINMIKRSCLQEIQNITYSYKYIHIYIILCMYTMTVVVDSICMYIV